MIIKLLFFVLPAFASVQNGTQRDLLTMAVGRLKQHVVTSREVNMNYFVESILYGKKGAKAPKEFYNVRSNDFSREVTAVLLEWVVFLESKGFESVSVSSEEVKLAQKRFLSSTQSSSLWKTLQASSNELNELLSRKLRAKKFIRFKVDSSRVPITDDEANAYFEQNRVKFGNLPFKNFRENIKVYLERQQVDRRLKDWFDVLQNKYKVRNFLSESDG